MYTKEKAIEALKKICNANKDIQLGVSEPGSAKWHKDMDLMTPIDWKMIGVVSALSEAFDITQKDMEV